MNVVRWLLQADPSIRWQTMHDLTNEPADAVRVERSLVATDGWGASLLAGQDADGHFVVGGRRGWSTDLHALVLLKDLGLEPTSSHAIRTIDRVRERVVWEVCDGRPFFAGETEPCINGAVVAIGAYFGEPCSALVDRLLGEQQSDGGWNCEAPPSTRASFHTTIRVLEGLAHYERRFGASATIAESRLRGEAYLLDRRLLRSLRSGEVIDPTWTRFAFPPTWHYDVLRGLDYLRFAGVRPDERISEAVALVAGRRDRDGRWPLDVRHPEFAFAMDPGIGRASAWNTLRAERVLAWARARSDDAMQVVRG